MNKWRGICLSCKGVSCDVNMPLSLSMVHDACWILEVLGDDLSSPVAPQNGTTQTDAWMHFNLSHKQSWRKFDGFDTKRTHIKIAAMAYGQRPPWARARGVEGLALCRRTESRAPESLLKPPGRAGGLRGCGFGALPPDREPKNPRA